MLQENKILSIIIPIFNEVRIIDRFLLSINKTFGNINCKFILIDDGSYDGTTLKVKETLKKNFSNKNYLYKKLERNFGKAEAIKEGIKYIDGEYTLLIDSDLEYSADDALELYQIALKNNSINIIQGSRYLGAKLQARKYIFNDLAVRINTFIFNFLFRQSITDLHTGTKIIKSKLLKSININYPRFGLEIDINAQIAKKNTYIYEYGISYIERSKEEGKKITLIDGLLAYYYLFRARFIQNDYATNLSVLYSFIFMTHIGTYFGLGIGKILITIVFAFIGLLIGLTRKILPLSLIFFSIYFGSLFSKGNGRILPIVLFFLLALYFSRKISQKYKKSNKNSILRFFI